MRLGVFLSGVEENVTVNEIKDNTEVFISENVPDQENLPTLIDEIRIFEYDGVRNVLIYFKSNFKKFYQFFQKLKECNLQGFDSHLDPKFFYDITDKRKSNWYAVIIRNLDQVDQIEKIKYFIDSFVPGRCEYVLDPLNWNENLATVAIMKDLDDAENLCTAINSNDINSVFTGRKVKVSHFLNSL